MSIKDKITPVFNCLRFTDSIQQKPTSRQARMLAWILLFLLVFSVAVFLVVYILNPHQDMAKNKYILFIGGLVIVLVLAYVLNCRNHYYASAAMLVGFAAITPWFSLLIDPSILTGDLIPLIYVTFAVILSSILLPIHITVVLALIQFFGLGLVLNISPIDTSLNWFSFLTYVFLTSVFSILTNSIIQREMKQIEEQTRQLQLNETLLREHSIRDHLTNLFNRRFLEETLEREILRASRKQTSVGIILLDLDNFKQINDTLGHSAGDIVLRELGRFLASQFRQSDVACRFGGDEFVIILPDTSLEITRERAEQLIAGSRNLQLPDSITISAGVSGFPIHGTDCKALLKYADEALFRAKHKGGNCVA